MRCGAMWAKTESALAMACYWLCKWKSLSLCVWSPLWSSLSGAEKSQNLLASLAFTPMDGEPTKTPRTRKACSGQAAHAKDRASTSIWTRIKRLVRRTICFLRQRRCTILWLGYLATTIWNGNLMIWINNFETPSRRGGFVLHLTDHLILWAMLSQLPITLRQ